MKDEFKWEYYKYKRYLARVKKRIDDNYFNSYAGRTFLSGDIGNEAIYNMLISEKPCVISRFGLTEMSVLANREAKKIHKKERDNDFNLCELSGFFPYDISLIDKFAENMIESIENIDILGIWYNRAEEYIVDKYMPRTSITGLTSIEPYFFAKPWSIYLKGKKVLVIHPFADSIENQYKRHSMLFDNKCVLPDFELKTIKAVQTLSLTKDFRFDTWFDALQYMKDQMDNIEFDVAIIGCGAYGMPLAIHAKKNGKQAVHMGGATQVLFGIKGHRWDENPEISRFYNDYWVRPNSHEKVEGQNKVENACYW